MSTSSIHRRLSRLVALAVGTLVCASAIAQSAQIDRLLFFGASLTDSGNSFVWLKQPDYSGCGTRVNVPPYDMLDDLLIPDGPYAIGGHHFSNGATWAEDLARSVALAANARPAFGNAGVKASNYAVGGARAVADYPCRFNLPAQVGMYLAESPQTSPNTWVGIEIGGNDVRDALVAAQFGGNAAAVLQSALEQVGDSIGLLYASGARRFFLLNVPDVGKTPAVRTLGPAAVVGGGQLSAAYNDGLAQLLEYLSVVLPGSDMRIVDMHQKLNEVVDNPQAYGFADATHACVTPEVAPFKCKRPDSYVFWDGIHPTKAMHEIVAGEALATIKAP